MAHLKILHDFYVFGVTWRCAKGRCICQLPLKTSSTLWPTDSTKQGIQKEGQVLHQVLKLTRKLLQGACFPFFSVAQGPCVSPAHSDVNIIFHVVFSLFPSFPTMRAQQSSCSCYSKHRLLRIKDNNPLPKESWPLLSK